MRSSIRNYGTLFAAMFALSGCTDLTPNGEACDVNADCESNHCVDHVCRVKTWKSQKTQNGDACIKSEDCESNNCVKNVCRVITWKEGDSAGIANGLACAQNEDCASNNCVSGVCRVSTWKESGKTPNGKACTSDSECESGNCYEGKVCRAATWNPGGSNGKTAGSACSLNSECASRVCVSGACADTGSGKFSSNKTGLGSTATGGSCTRNAQCESGLCDNGICSDDCARLGCAEAYYVCRANKCIPVESQGTECTLNEDCGIGYFCCNGFCSENKCEVGISCESSDTRCNNGCGSHDYCTCSGDTECGNNMYCGYDSSWGNVCYPKKQVNASCSSNSQCADGLYCSSKCVLKKDLDESCSQSYECASGLCVSNKDELCDWYYWYDCYCKPPRENGEKCMLDSNCKSGYCKPSTSTCESR